MGDETAHAQLQRIDEICEAFEQQWAAGQRPDLTEFLSQVAESDRTLLFQELVSTEVDWRNKRGESLGAQEYVDRFPELQSVIQHVFGDKWENDETISAASSPQMHTQVPHQGSSSYDLPELFGRYKIIKALGKGGMGAVYLAEDPTLERKIAIKVPFLNADQNDSILERFYREAKSVAALRHPNICPVHEVGETNGTHFMTMAFIEGKSLADFAKPDQPLSIKVVLNLVRKVALALEEAHSHGIIHRDLKPANVMIDKKKEPVIMDFGLARREGKPEEQLTRDGSLVGTPHYMSPEQVSGKVDQMGPGCDIYSLGVVLYRLLTGRVPFDGDLLSLVRQIALDEPVSPREIRPEIDLELESICMKAMAKKVEDRFASMKEFAAAVTDCLKSRIKAGSDAAELDTGKNEETLAERAQDNLPAQVTVAEAGEVAAEDKPAEIQPSGSSAGSAPVSYAQSQPQAVRQRRWPFPLIAIGVGGALLLLAGVILFLPTKKGTIKIEINDPRIEVTVNENGYTIKGTDEEIELRPGEHSFHVKRGELEFDTKKFMLGKGENPALRVELLAGQVRVVQNNVTLGSKSITGQPDNYALAFDERSRVELHTLRYNGSHPITIELRVRPAKVSLLKGTQGHRIIGFHDVMLVVAKEGKYQISWSEMHEDGKGHGTFKYVRSTENATAGMFVHLAAIWDGSALAMFIDGKLQDSRKVGDNWQKDEDGQWLRLGFLDPFSFSGTIDEVRISNIARYDEDFAPPKPNERFEPDEQTLALYHFDEGQDDILYDSSGNGNHAHIRGATWVNADGTPLEPLTEHVSDGDPDRQVAEWVLEMGGTVGVMTEEWSLQYAHSLDDLPDGRVFLLKVNWGSSDFDLASAKKILAAQRIGSISLSEITNITLEGLHHLPLLRSLQLDKSGITDAEL